MLEETCKWLQNNVTPSTTHLHHTLNRPDNFTCTPVNENNLLITLKPQHSKVRIKKESALVDDNIMVADISTAPTQFICSNQQVLNELISNINKMVETFNRQRSPLLHDSDMVTLDQIKDLQRFIRSEKRIHNYHKSQALKKISEIKGKLQYYQKKIQEKPCKPDNDADQRIITSFFHCRLHQ